MSNVVRDGEMPNGSPLPIGEGVAMNQCSRCGGELGTADTDGLCAVCRYKPSAQAAGSVSESDRALAMIRDATDHALDEVGLVESVAVLISQRNNARRYAETFRAKLKELGHEFI